MLYGLDLFSGIGGIAVGLGRWVTAVAYCERDEYCQSVLLSRMSKGDLSKAPIWDDVCTLSPKEIPCVDIITAGFPCQDISVAGKGKGLEGERSGLFFEIVRLAKEIEPSFIFLENVPAITSRGGLRVVREIAAMGYDCRWCIISASSVGALHKRERWFLLAHSASKGTNRYTSREEAKLPMLGKCGHDGDTECESGKQAYQSAESQPNEGGAWQRPAGFGGCDIPPEDWKKAVSEMGKCSDGLPYYVDRLRALGNAVVPAQVEKAFSVLIGINR